MSIPINNHGMFYEIQKLNPEPDAETLKAYLEASKKTLALLEKYVHDNLVKDKYLVGKAVRSYTCLFPIFLFFFLFFSLCSPPLSRVADVYSLPYSTAQYAVCVCVW